MIKCTVRPDWRILLGGFVRAENCLDWGKVGVHIAKWEVGGVDRADLGQNVLEVICVKTMGKQ